MIRLHLQGKRGMESDLQVQTHRLGREDLVVIAMSCSNVTEGRIHDEELHLHISLAVLVCVSSTWSYC